MHPFDLLYRGLNLTEPSQDNPGLVRTWVLWMGVSLAVAWQLSVQFPNWPPALDVIAAVALLAAPFPATFITFAAAQARACRIETSDVVELSLLGASSDLSVEDGLRLTSARVICTVWRDGNVWRRRERSLDRPFTLTMPLHTAEEEAKVSGWWMSADVDDVDATVRLQLASPGRIDQLRSLQWGDELDLVVADGRSELKVTFLPSGTG